MPKHQCKFDSSRHEPFNEGLNWTCSEKNNNI